MTTAQDQQSRAEFEAFWRKEMNVEAMDLARTNYPMTPPEKQQYLCHETNRAWITWQAARALPAGEPVGWVDDGGMVFWKDSPPADGEDLFTASQVLAMGRVPPGFQYVPVVPTAEMIAVGRNYTTLAVGTYRAMCDAAPRPPAAQEPIPSNSAGLRRKPLDRIAVLVKIDAVLCKEKNPLQAAEEICTMANQGITHPTGD